MSLRNIYTPEQTARLYKILGFGPMGPQGYHVKAPGVLYLRRGGKLEPLFIHWVTGRPHICSDVREALQLVELFLVQSHSVLPQPEDFVYIYTGEPEQHVTDVSDAARELERIFHA